MIGFYGLGNETQADAPSRLYEVHQVQYLVEPEYVVRVAPHMAMALGAVAQYATTDLRPGTFIGAARPYGTPHFGQIGPRLSFSLDTRDRQVAATRGVHVNAGGMLFPALWGVESTFGKAYATAATYLSAAAPLDPTLALRASGERVWGTFPFHEAAFVGGSSTLRGWSEQRFAGRGSLYGNAELRLALVRFLLFIPCDLGIFGLADAGRVYADGEQSSEWHTAWGGGVWFAPLKRTNTVSLGVARGQERTGVYIRTGFLF